jgi:Cdc6-like AAA superfamily ATPase
MTDLASNGSVSIRLKDNWDASLGYDVLEEDAATAADPIFVGRQELLGPIVNAIGQTDRRGTYLISGYRGAGKTSLVIEAARQARAKLESDDWHILPVVLNVSEVSASLSDASRSTVGPLQVDARRLLTAMLRQLRNRLPVRPDEKDENKANLARKIDWAYTKADAATYVQRSQQRLENRRTELIESRLDAKLSNVLKLGGGVLAVAAAALGVGVLASPVTGVIAAGAGLAVVSYGVSRTVSRASEGRDTAEIELTTDNSVHQLENELKEIFAELYKLKQRTIVVLEELDKVDDPEGKQLDSVIRYFKNLFTQAPALFFFITDKQYYDLIETRIDQARRLERTYSIEHTFFTHRVFVNRPTVGACLDYLRAVAADEDERRAIDDIVAAETDRVRDLASMDLRERLLRVLLFRAEDHIFDLKNAMRGYVNVVDGQSILECDEDSLPVAEQALATFQFLVERKARSYGFRGGRDYANEVLRNCLFAVFDDTDPSIARDYGQFAPREEDQLGPAEEQQIVRAVSSLIEDLARGGALERDPTQFTWQENSAVRFTPVADLEPHEKQLAQDLELRLAVLSGVGDGPLRDVVDDDAVAAEELVRRLEDQLERVRSAGVALPEEEASSISSGSAADVARLVDRVYDRHRARLVSRLGRELEQVRARVAGSIWQVPRTEDEPGSVLLVYGSGERLVEAVAALLTEADPSGRVAIVQVVPADGSTDQTAAVLREWDSFRVGRELACSVVSLDEGLGHDDVKERWAEATADELVLAELWVGSGVAPDRVLARRAAPGARLVRAEDERPVSDRGHIRLPRSGDRRLARRRQRGPVLGHPASRPRRGRAPVRPPERHAAAVVSPGERSGARVGGAALGHRDPGPRAAAGEPPPADRRRANRAGLGSGRAAGRAERAPDPPDRGRRRALAAEEPFTAGRPGEGVAGHRGDHAPGCAGPRVHVRARAARAGLGSRSVAGAD